MIFSQNGNSSEQKIIEQILQDYERDSIQNYDEAITQINKCIQVIQDSEVFRVRGLIYDKLQEKVKALNDYNMALIMDAHNVKAYNSCWKMDQNLQEEAVEDFDKAIMLDPYFYKTYYNRGYIYKSNKQYDKAILDLSKAIELNPEEATILNNRGNTYKIMKQYDKAILDYSKAIELNPEYATVFNNRGNTYYDMKQYDKAILDLSKTIELNPKFAAAFYNRGNTYKNMKQYEKAILDFSKAIELNPEDARMFKNRAHIFKQIQLYDKAILDYRQALYINPNEIDALIFYDVKMNKIILYQNKLTNINLLSPFSILINYHQFLIDWLSIFCSMLLKFFYVNNKNHMIIVKCIIEMKKIGQPLTFLLCIVFFILTFIIFVYYKLKYVIFFLSQFIMFVFMKTQIIRQKVIELYREFFSFINYSIVINLLGGQLVLVASLPFITIRVIISFLNGTLVSKGFSLQGSFLVPVDSPKKFIIYIWMKFLNFILFGKYHFGVAVIYEYLFLLTNFLILQIIYQQSFFFKFSQFK